VDATAEVIAYVLRRGAARFAAAAQESQLVKLIHAQRISTIYEKVVVLALIVNAVLFGVFVLLPTAHGKAPGGAVQPQESIRITEAETPSLAEVCALRESHADQVRGD
jgi:hypothetical protein